MGTTGSDDVVPAGSAAAAVRDRLTLLAALGYGFLECGQTERAIVSAARSIGLDGFAFNSFGRMLLLEATAPDGSTVTVSGAARALDTIDCTRAHALARIAHDLTTPAEQPAADAPTAPAEPVATDGDRDGRRLAAVRDAVERVRATATPWWATTLGMTMLAFAITMQVGVGWRAWASAALVQVATSLVGLGVGRIGMPKLFATAVQSSVGGAVATLLVLGVVTVALAARTGYPQQVLALLGITGALLPGIPVFFGILQEMGGASGAEDFASAAAISLGISTGVAFGVYVASLRDRFPATDRRSPAAPMS